VILVLTRIEVDRHHDLPQFDRHATFWADARAFDNTGPSRPISTAMMPITTAFRPGVNPRAAKARTGRGLGGLVGFPGF